MSSDSTIRIDKYLANMGRGSRSEIKRDIRNGRVCIGDELAFSGFEKVRIGVDSVKHNGELVEYKPHVYLMLNKPAGYISSTEDDFHKTVCELIPEEYVHYAPFPVGRLDIDTTGLLLLTNDGDFAHSITSPAKNIPKRYVADLSAPLSGEAEQRLLDGVEIEAKKKLYRCRAVSVTADCGRTRAELVITEGKFHQVKKMFEAVGVRVKALRRVSIGALELDPNLPEGKSRELTSDELALLIMAG